MDSNQDSARMLLVHLLRQKTAFLTVFFLYSFLSGILETLYIYSVRCPLGISLAPAFAADFPPDAHKFNQRTLHVRLINLCTPDKKSSHKIKHKETPREHLEKKEDKTMTGKKKTGFMLAMLIVMAMGAGCSGNKVTDNGDSKTEAPTTSFEASTENENEVTDDADEEEKYDTGDATLDNVRNQNDIGEKELLVVSFGTSYNDNRRFAIGAIENAMEKSLQEYSVRRAFTSQIIIDHVNKRDKVKIDNVKEALDRAVNNGVKSIVIQPTHIMDGFEYQDLKEEVAGYGDAFESIAIGKPLLSSDEDFKTVMDIITDVTAQYDDGETAICFMGHGTEAKANGVYEKMQKLLIENGKTNYFIGTVEAKPTLEDVLEKVKEGNYKKVVLRPLMIVAGDHANNDMAGDEEDSWKSTFEAAGFEVECVLEGLGQLEGIQNLFVKHAKEAAKQ